MNTKGSIKDSMAFPVSVRRWQGQAIKNNFRNAPKKAIFEDVEKK